MDTLLPNRILLVTIKHMLYPITVEVLHQVFSPYGYVEKIFTFQKSDGFQALIQFQLCQSAVSARNFLQGRDIYDGCCRLDIKFSILEDVQVKYNNEQSRDFTNPLLPLERKGRHSQNYGLIDYVEPAKFNMENYDAAFISEVDRTMKKHTDNLMHMLVGVSARLLQLENSVEDLKASRGNNHGRTDGKLRQIENTIREVQASVQVVRLKQEIVETQLQLSNLQISNAEQQSETQILGKVTASTPLEPSGCSTEAPLQQYQPPLPQQQMEPSSPPLKYQPSPRIQSQLPPLRQQLPSLSSVDPKQNQAPVDHHSDEPPHLHPGGAPQIPHALPTGSVVGGGSGSSYSLSNNGNKAPTGDVVAKLTSMGSPEDQVRSTGKTLTENGQAVDLNVVVD